MIEWSRLISQGSLGWGPGAYLHRRGYISITSPLTFVLVGITMTCCADILHPFAVKNCDCVSLATSQHVLFTINENQLALVHLRISPGLLRLADLLNTYSRPYAT